MPFNWIFGASRWRHMVFLMDHTGHHPAPSIGSFSRVDRGTMFFPRFCLADCREAGRSGFLPQAGSDDETYSQDIRRGGATPPADERREYGPRRSARQSLTPRFAGSWQPLAEVPRADAPRHRTRTEASRRCSIEPNTSESRQQWAGCEDASSGRQSLRSGLETSATGCLTWNIP